MINGEDNMKKVKLISILLAMLLMCTLIFSGCQNNDKVDDTKSGGQSTTSKISDDSDSSNSKKVTLKFEQFSGSGENEEFLKQMIAEYKKLYPNVDVKLQTIGFNDYFTQMMAKISAGQAPDVFELNFENFVTYAKKDVLMPLDDIIKEADYDVSIYNQKALNAFVIDNKQYGLPNSFSNVLLFYNKDLFDKAKISYPTNEWTWDDTIEAAEKIRSLDKTIFGFFRPVTFNEFYKVVKQNDGALFNDDMTQFTVNRPENIETLQFMVDALLKSNVMPTEEQLAGMGDWDLFKAGRLGMLTTGVWAIPDFTRDCDFDWDIAIEPGNKQKATHFFSNGYVISKDTKNAETAFEFASFLTSSKEAVDIRLDAGWELPPVSDAEVIEKYKTMTPPENRQAVFDSIDYLVTPPVIEQYKEMEDLFNKYLTEASTGKTSVEDALDKCQKELEEKITLK
jgi:multiple sugar transport system substrate-binding protein